MHEGTHINALGAREPGMQELDPTLLTLGKVFVLDLTRAIRSGEINVPLAKGFSVRIWLPGHSKTSSGEDGGG